MANSTNLETEVNLLLRSNFVDQAVMVQGFEFVSYFVLRISDLRCMIELVELYGCFRWSLFPGKVSQKASPFTLISQPGEMPRPARILHPWRHPCTAAAASLPGWEPPVAASGSRDSAGLEL
jgi:hypothetical protein